ncbi:MAG: prephenate dehydratase [Polyangiaceae bacterium]
MSIDDLRRRIDGIDDELLDLLERRAQAAREIAQAKRAEGVAAHDPERERALVERLEVALEAKPSATFPVGSVRPVFREIMSACLSLEEPQTVAYMGPSGTFSHIAAHSAFGLGARYIETPTIGAVLEAVARGTATYGVAPIENSTEGGVTATLDAFLELDVMIQREFVIEVTQCLLGRERDLGKIRRVYSHPQPLAQCRSWLSRHLPQAEIVTSPSTAVAAREAASEEFCAAIGSSLSAELYGLEILRESIQDRAENATRFVVVAKDDAERSGRDKTSVAFSAAHVRGALRRALEIFDDEGLNLTRIESRPALGRRWEYVFFTDFEGHRTDANVAKAIERLRHACSTVRVLGSYPRNDSI